MILLHIELFEVVNMKKENNKKAVEYVQRLVAGRIPQCDVTFNYLSSSNSGEKIGKSLFIENKKGRSSETASCSTVISSRRAL